MRENREYGSLLDRLEESQVAISTIAKNDISGSLYHLEPFRFRYLLDVPFEIVDMVSPGIEEYIADLDYILSSFTNDYQILLRKISQDDKSYENFIQLSTEELRKIDLKVHKHDDRYRYSGALFVQFNTEPDWSYKKLYRFQMSLGRLFEKHEKLDYKLVYIYKRSADLHNCVRINEIDNIANKKNIFIRYNKQCQFRLTDDTPIKVVLEDIENSKPVADVLYITEEWDKAVLFRKIDKFKSFADDIVKNTPIMSYNERARYLMSISKGMNEKYESSILYNEDFFKKYVKEERKKRLK